MRAKTTRAFRTISEAGEELGLQPHVLRFWESKFSDIKPIKRGGGRRFYRPEDIEFIRGIKTLLYDEKHPIKDVQKLIAKSGAERIIELGRSVEQASRERSVQDMPLVPARLKPRSDSEPKRAPQPIASVISIDEEDAQSERTAAPEPVSTEPEPIADFDTAREVLAQLEQLKTRWSGFQTSAG